MQHLSTAFLIIPLVIVVYQASRVAAQDDRFDEPFALESKHRAVTIIAGPKYVTHPTPNNQTAPTHKPASRPPSKPPIVPIKTLKHHVDIPRPHHGHVQKIPPPRIYPKKMTMPPYTPNSIYKYPRVIPLPAHYRHHYYYKRPLVYAASISKPSFAKSPKFSLPVKVVNAIRSDIVKPPKFFNTTTTSTTTTEAAATTTQKLLRTKRIWPTRALENSTSDNTTITDNSTRENENSTIKNTTALPIRNNVTTTYNTTKISIADDRDRDTWESRQQVRYVYSNATADLTTALPSTPTTRRYRPVTRQSKVNTTTSTTLSPINFTRLGKEWNDWVPIFPSHYPHLKKPAPTPISKRSDKYNFNSKAPPGSLYLQSFGLFPVNPSPTPVMARKKMVLFKRKRQLNPYYSGYSPRPGRPQTRYTYGDLETDGSHSHPRVVTKIKHHHHHHHHKYIKTVEKPIKVPYKVEVPKPYPVQVEKQVPVETIKVVEKPVPYPVHVEKKIPYPIGIKVPVPYKVIEKEYVSKPYPIIHHVPVQVEKRVPYPVEVKVPVEKRVPYPVPVKIIVPQPYPVETKVPYPVEVKVREPIEVIKHVPVKVPYPQPYPVKVPHPVPVPVEKRVPYPVEVEKKVPVKVFVPHRVEVEKKVPVYIPQPYPVEKRVPYPVKVPVQVPVEVPVHFYHPYPVYGYNYQQDDISNGVTATPSIEVTSTPLHTVTVHGNIGFNGFQERSDHLDTTTATTRPIIPDS